MKKFLIMFMVVTLLMVCVAVPAAFAADTYKATVAVSPDPVNKGEDVTVAVTMPDDLPKLAVMGIVISYDDDAFTVKSAPNANWMFGDSGRGNEAAGNYFATDFMNGDAIAGTTLNFVFTSKADAKGGEYTFVVAFDENNTGTAMGEMVAIEVGEVTVNIVCEHTETEVKGAKDATCSEEGNTGDVVCKECGTVITPGTTIPTTDHNYVAGTVVAPDCDDAGYTVYTCSGCGATENRDPVAALGHTPGETVVENDVKPTCTEAGSYDNVVYCSVCEKELSRETVTVEALGHTEGDVVVENDKKPTCTEEGSYDNVVYCTVCEKELSREKVTVEALGHDEKIDEAVEPTCTETGLTEGSHCERCKEVLVAQTVVDALNHDVKIDVAVEPTCTDTGLTEGKHCDRCGEVLVAQTVVDALGHTGGEATCVKRAVCDRCSQEYGELNKDNHKGTSDLIGAKDPTCTEVGATGTGTCSDCGAELDASEVIPALGHAWDEGVVTTPATCEADGVKTFTCGRCGDIYTEAVAKLGHAYDSGVVTTPATCEAEGVKTFTCQNDATHTYTEAIPAIGHNYDEGTVTTEPTCEADGVKTFVCQNDPSHTYTEAVAAIGHDWELTETIIAPDCEADGEGVYTCKNDASHTKNDVIEKLGHAWDEGTVTKEATTSEEGEMTYKCTVEGCDGTLVEPIEKLKPSGGNSGSDKDNSNIPDTGDDAPIALMAAILTVCAAGVVVLTSKKRKNEI